MVILSLSPQKSSAIPINQPVPTIEFFEPDLEDTNTLYHLDVFIIPSGVENRRESYIINGGQTFTDWHFSWPTDRDISAVSADGGPYFATEEPIDEGH